MTIILHILIAGLFLFNAIFFASVEGFIKLPEMLAVLLDTYSLYIHIALLVELPLVYFIVTRLYIRPINILSREIAAFYTGVREEPQDLVFKPGSRRGISYVTNFFIQSFQVLKKFKDEIRSGRQLKSEVEIASEIQRSALEHDSIIIPSLEVAYAIKSATEVGGDSCDIIEGSNGNHYLYVGDATGHGVPSGFIMMMVNSLISFAAFSESNGAKILAQTNKIVKPRVKQNMLMTCVLLRWNEDDKKMYFTGAGHEYILVYKAMENKVYPIKSGGVAIGMIKDSSKILKEQQIAFEEGDIITLYTDGISEARYKSKQDGMLFGIDRIMESILKSDSKTVESIFRQITIDISAFMGYKHVQYDDITLMVIKYSPGNGKIITDLPARIPDSHITEWNWGKVQDTSRLAK